MRFTYLMPLLGYVGRNNRVEDKTRLNYYGDDKYTSSKLYEVERLMCTYYTTVPAAAPCKYWC